MERKHHARAAKFVACHAEHQPANQHARHLQIQKQNAFIQQQRFRHAKFFQARHAHGGEHPHIVDIHEIAEAGDEQDKEDAGAGGLRVHEKMNTFESGSE